MRYKLWYNIITVDFINMHVQVVNVVKEQQAVDILMHEVGKLHTQAEHKECVTTLTSMSW